MIKIKILVMLEDSQGEHTLIVRECDVEERPVQEEVLERCLEEFQAALKEEKARQVMVEEQDREDWEYYHSLVG
ncbi:MAG: hypothetical protein PHX30_01735 [Candidatus Pacebacteria bacterium]|nr:hypothetical protein [Candidatus Paceibacterota bacterium]